MRMPARGFTLIELLMTMMLISIIAIVGQKFFLQMYRSFITSQNISDADWQGFVALNRFADDLHTIRSANDITSIGSTAMTFVDVNGNTIQYQLSGTTLLRNSIVLADSIQSLALSYSNSSGTTTATASQVRYITISATLLKNNFTTTFSTVVGTRGMT